MKKISQNRKEKDGVYAIQMIEHLFEEIMRRHAYPAERARQALVHFAKGYSDFTVHSQRSTAVLGKISTMVQNLLNSTCLNAQEIDDLIVMVVF